MVLGSVVKGMTYPKYMYYSGKAYGFGYLPKALIIEPEAWNDESSRWLAKLYGLTYERTLPPEGANEDEAWQDYLERIEGYLRAGSAVQTSRGWMGARQEKNGKIIAFKSTRVFWWEGMSKLVKPDMHYYTIVGLDKDAGQAIMNDPIFGWFGLARETPVKLNILRQAVRKLKRQHRYITIAFKRGAHKAMSEEQIEALIRKRLRARVAGDDSVYDTKEMWAEFFHRPARRGFAHGVNAIRAFRADLDPNMFGRLLAARQKRTTIRPVDLISWLDLNIYHQAWMTMVSAEYLEKEGRLNEWAWSYKLALLFHELNIASTKLRAIFKAEPHLDMALTKSRAVLREIDQALARIEQHMINFLR
jgi:hypothetical protein